MSLGTARLLGSLAISAAVGAAALAFVTVEPPLTRLHALPSLVASIGAACLLFVVLSRQVRVLRRPRRGRVASFTVRGAFLTVTSAAEEILWRWLVLGGLTPAVGLVPAFLASTVGFALAHGVRRADVVAVHLATGSAFGAVYVVTGHVEAAIVAHAVYNWLVLAAIETAASARRLPATVGDEVWGALDRVRSRDEVEVLRRNATRTPDMSFAAILLSRGQQLRSARSGRGAARERRCKRCSRS